MACQITQDNLRTTVEPDWEKSRNPLVAFYGFSGPYLTAVRVTPGSTLGVFVFPKCLCLLS